MKKAPRPSPGDHRRRGAAEERHAAGREVGAGVLDTARSRVKQIQVQLDELTIRAPQAALVQTLDLRPGDMQKVHDERVKLIAEETMDYLGQVQREFEIPASDAQRIDLWFRRQNHPEKIPGYLELLDKMFPGDALIDAFSEAFGTEEFWKSHPKQYAMRRQLQDEHDKERKKAGPGVERRLIPLPPLWLLSAGRPQTLFDTYDIRPKPDFPDGVYEFGRGFFIGLVVISELPCTRGTLLLRLMGKEEARERALAEIRGLLPSDPDKPLLLRFLSKLQHTIRHAKNISDEQREELLMTAAGAEFERYEQELIEKSRKEGMDKGIEKGIEKGKAQMLLRILQARGLSVSDEARTRILACSDSTMLDLWADRSLVATRVEDIFATG
jgi:hypothetical protein